MCFGVLVNGHPGHTPSLSTQLHRHTKGGVCSPKHCCLWYRDKEHSTIIYESPQPDTPLLRLSWNKQDPRYMATVCMDSTKVVILDIR